MSAGPKTPAWLVVWQCGCHDVQAGRRALPDVCPGHGSAPIKAPEHLEVLDRYVGAHECGERPGDTPCPTTSTQETIR